MTKQEFVDIGKRLKGTLNANTIYENTTFGRVTAHAPGKLLMTECIARVVTDPIYQEFIPGFYATVTDLPSWNHVLDGDKPREVTPAIYPSVEWPLNLNIVIRTQRK